MQLIKNKGVLDRRHLPSNFEEVLWASFRRATKDVIKQTGTTRADVSKRLPAIVAGLKKNLDSSLSINSFHTRTELRIIEVFATTLVAQPAFDDARLLADFTATLRSHGLLQQSELREFGKLRPRIAAFAAAIMHNCVIRLPDGGTILLSINIGNSITEKINVSAAVEIEDEAFKKATNASGLFIASTIFSTEVAATAGCTGELLKTACPWAFDIELTHEGLLAKLG
jgi:hypothetical protein